MNELLFLLRIGAFVAVLAVAALVVWRRRKRVVASVCAHLGLETDPFARETRPIDAHRCYANLARERIDLGHQRRFCLASTHNKCPFLAMSVRHEAGVLPVMRARWRIVSPAIGLLARQLGRDFAAGLANATPHATTSAIGWRGLADGSLTALARCGALARQQAVSVWAWAMALSARRAESAASAMHAPAASVASEPEPIVALAPVVLAEPIVLAEPVMPMALVGVGEPVEVAEPVMPTAPTWAVEAEQVVALELPRVEILTPADASGPGLSNRVAAVERDLVERGIGFLQSGREAEAYAVFKRATEVDKRAVRAWFWRAKTAETLDEVVRCLKCAHELDPSNVQIAANLDWAHARLAAAKSTDQPAKAEVPKVAVATIGAPRRRALGWRMVRLGREVCRAAAALAAFVVAAAWLLGALPPQLHAALVNASGIPELPLPEMNRLTDLVHYSLAGGYDVGSALPFVVGFLALFVGMGLLSGDGWTRLWAPVIGVASAWAWSLAPGAAVSAYLLPACGAVVLGGALSGEWRVLRLD